MENKHKKTKTHTKKQKNHNKTHHIISYNIKYKINS